MTSLQTDITDLKSRPKRHDHHGLASIALVIGYVFLILFPVMWMWSLAFKPEDVMFARPTVWFFTPTFEHFQYMLQNGYHEHLLNSLIISTLSTALVVVIGTPAAYAFARFRDMKFRDDLFLFVLATRMAPPVCLIIPYYLIYAKIGLLDTYLGLTIAYLTFNLSFYVWVLSSFCRDLPLELEEAARMDGAGLRQEILYVLTPMAIPGIASTVLLNFILAWNEAFWTLNLTAVDAAPLTAFIASYSSPEGLFFAKLSAASTMAIAPILILGWFSQKQLVRGLTFGAVK